MTWAEKFRSLATEPMSMDDCKLFMALATNTQSLPEEIELDKSFQLTFLRAKHIFESVDWQAAVFITAISKSPAQVVMYLSAIPSPNLTMLTIGHAFPDGFLSQQDLNLMWDAQKENGRNSLDV